MSNQHLCHQVDMVASRYIALNNSGGRCVIKWLYWASIPLLYLLQLCFVEGDKLLPLASIGRDIVVGVPRLGKAEGWIPERLCVPVCLAVVRTHGQPSDTHGSDNLAEEVTLRGAVFARHAVDGLTRRASGGCVVPVTVRFDNMVSFVRF